MYVWIPTKNLPSVQCMYVAQVKENDLIRIPTKRPRITHLWITKSETKSILTKNSSAKDNNFRRNFWKKIHRKIPHITRRRYIHPITTNPYVFQSNKGDATALKPPHTHPSYKTAMTVYGTQYNNAEKKDVIQSQDINVSWSSRRKATIEAIVHWGYRPIISAICTIIATTVRPNN